LSHQEFATPQKKSADEHYLTGYNKNLPGFVIRLVIQQTRMSYY